MSATVSKEYFDQLSATVDQLRAELAHCRGDMAAVWTARGELERAERQQKHLETVIDRLQVKVGELSLVKVKQDLGLDMRGLRRDIDAIHEFERGLVERIEFLEGEKQSHDNMVRIDRLADDMSRWQARLETVEDATRDGNAKPLEDGSIPRLLVEDMIDLIESLDESGHREERMLRRLRRLIGEKP